MTRTLARPALAAFLLGAASVAAFEPVGFYPLIFPTLAGFFGLLDAAASRKTGFRGGALLGGAFGFGLFIAGVSWIFVSLSTFGNMPAPLAAFATILFCLVESLFPALAGALFVRFASESKPRRVLFFAALWTLAEVLRGSGSFGFPWLAIGYSQTPPSPLAAFAPIVGVYGVSLIVALAAAPLSEVARGVFRRSGESAEMPPPSATCKTCRCRPFLPLLAIVAAGICLRPIEWTAPTGAPLKLAIAQGNIAQEMKWRPEHFHETLRVFLRLVEENPAQLTILPEAAFPAFLDQIPRDYVGLLSALARREGGGLIVGIPTRESEGRAYNSALLLGALEKNAAVKYDKSHLVPFGEFVPPGFKWFLELVEIPMSNFAPGAQKQPILRVGDQRIAVNICYEDAFGGEIARALPEATLLVNLSNVAWFGDSLAPAQHLQISQMRALETGRTMLRATNTGMTAIIGPDGRVVKRLAPFTRNVLRGEAQGYAGTTPFVRWGNWLVIAIALVLSGIRRQKTGDR
ncbi:MAG: apolipoprotein N-acyltransferase [Candidatus Accumulibacter sp.]|jgi:apolipoprotein N-acyltransferase|nr:apolipoprotein N-acyltransferase [Accumulibacter sp.]